MAKPRNVVDMVVARLPPPDRFKSKKSSGGRSSSYDEEDDKGPSTGELSAFEDMCKAMGIKPKDSQAGATALRDFFAICDQGEDDKEEADEGDDKEE